MSGSGPSTSSTRPYREDDGVTPSQPADWLLVRTAPGEYAVPSELPSGGHRVTAPATIATMLTDSPWPNDDIDDHDWWLCTSYHLDRPTRLELDGLIPPATVFVDDVAVTEVDSMFLPVTVELSAGQHHVVIRFESLRRWLKVRRGRGRWRSTLVADQGLRWLRTTLLGRAPVYGGGLLPAPAGVWRQVRARSSATIDDLCVTPEPLTGRVTLSGRLYAPPAHPTEESLRLTIEGPDGDVVTHDVEVGPGRDWQAIVTVDDPQLWWPAGYGAQPLYRLSVTDLSGHSLAHRLFGFRTVSADESGGGFVLRVNGIAVFCRGATWVPPDPIALQADSSALHAHVDAYARAGATMLRVVGGMLYEQPSFYERCAERGILVWQDAMQATFDPPAELNDILAQEQSRLLRQLTGNPALAVVSGGSETEQQPEMFGLDRANCAIPVLTDNLRSVVGQLADVPYVTSSPSSRSADGSAIAPHTGVAHWFGVGGYLRPLDDVTRAGIRFAAECLAFAIPPSDDFIERHFGSLAVAGHHPQWKAGVPRDRTASWDFEDVRDHYVRSMFGVDPLAVRRIDPQRYLQLGRLAVTEAMLTCYRYWRRPDSQCAGALVLSGKDIVAGAGWGLLDADGDAKLPLRALARIWAPIATTISDAGLSGIRIDLYNDTDKAIEATLTLSVSASEQASTSVLLPARSSQTCYDSDISGTFADLSHAYRFGPVRSDAIEVRLVGAGGELLARDVLVVAPHPAPVPAQLHATLTPGDSDNWVLAVSSAACLRYVCLELPAGWSASDDCFGLMAAVPHRVILQRTKQSSTTSSAPRVRVSSIDARDSCVATPAPTAAST